MLRRPTSPKIPKQFRAPRPTSLGGRRRHRLLRIAPFEALVVAVAVGFVALCPWTFLDEWANDTLLRWNTTRTPPSSVMLLRVDPSLQALADCGTRLSHSVEVGHARGVVFMAPADRLCAPPEATLDSVTWRPSCAAEDGSPGTGFRCTADAAAALRRLGIPTPRQFVPTEPRSVPSAMLDDIGRGHLPASVVSGRVLVVEVGSEVSPEARRAAATIASGLSAQGRERAPRWLAVLFTVVFTGLLAFLRRTRAAPAWPPALGFAVLSVLLGYLAARYGTLGMLPLAALLGALLLAVVLIRMPNVIATRKALRHAADLIERAVLLRSDGIHTIPDAEFWSRIGDLVSQAHPAESVLVAELPPREWHLKFWPYKGLGENMIQERRRDIRRTPYSNEAGTPEITVTRKYLAIEGTPAVIVPLIALGEVEGYVFLCGDSAERAYRRAPQAAERLSQDLGLILRRRRVADIKDDKWRRTAGSSTRQGTNEAAQLAEGAALALGDLRMFTSLVRNAPVGLLYADAFGHVRVLGNAFVDWLPRIGVPVPSTGTGAPLAPGALMLGRVLEALSEEGIAPMTLAEVTASPEGQRFEVPMPQENGQNAKLVTLSLRALFESSDGVSWVAGYVGALVEGSSAASAEGQEPLRFPAERLTEVLSVRSLSESLRTVARAASARSGRPVRFEPPRERAYAVAYHTELAEAIEDLLYEATMRDSSGKGPVVTLHEDGDRIHISILDLQFGLPTSALRRALRAPSDPPEGLEVFARFAFTVAESHGTVELLEDDWGVTVEAQVLRARPLTRTPSLRPMRPRSNSQQKVG